MFLFAESVRQKLSQNPKKYWEEGLNAESARARHFVQLRKNR